MAPKKAQKMSLNDFLSDSALGSWADEMDALPSAPAARLDGDSGRPGDRRRDDFSSRSDRASFPPREDLPLPTEPPFTAFIGNLSFDVTEFELENFFKGLTTKSVKLIRDREDKPKGFGYIEFADLDGLKEALEKHGSSFAGRTIRVSVAEPPKERSGFGGGGFDDEKFASPWRREGPLPDLPSRDGSRRRFDGPPSRDPPPTSISETASDWRSSTRAPVRPPPESELRRRSFRESAPETHSAADTEESWSRGSKFRPAAPPAEGPGNKFGKPRGDMGPPRDAPSPPDEGDWRRPRAISRNSTSPSNSTPPTPNMGRRKLELLPRSSGTSAAPSPLASPNPSTTAPSAPRSNPFGAARPVDVTAKEKAVEERLEKEKERMHTMSRTGSQAASQRGQPRPAPSASAASPTSPTAESAGSKSPLVSANVRPSFSFASAAAAGRKASDDGVQEVTEGIDEVQI
ncbi:hypothetical protein WOLCODRAFT_137991 [Wolfiporia cocos MD-104 SS10]|uniref:RRM domain-containing protein n=1 Tax=Wolfiporia cocos (strain MD-104) TaxID=742152 RepID=A0A2H3JK94_WOLCO|nr:hypothetical protein WOLCODRAFT_137991 [Wolfiporia cocos MD-104 SS10]